ncbi:MAG: hypothetical protein R1F54_06560 [Candidatus Zeuxoniibacter abyssi]|nr:MAG: hypothetical protein R1F54_06560 [Candidatus Persebacteraceae bacterium AB1(2)]
MGIEQKLKIIGYAERRGKAACYDAFDVKARTLRRWRRLYREEGAMALSYGSVLIGANTNDTKRQRNGI